MMEAPTLRDVRLGWKSPAPQAPTYDYRAFGLSIRSDIELPELWPASFERADVRIWTVPTRSDFPPPGAPGDFLFGENESFMLWPPVGAFRVVGNGTILVEPAPGAEAALLAFPLLGPVFAVLLQARGALVLHGSALRIAGLGIGFLGDKGAGKSTTASALIAAGHRLLTDDVLAIDGWKRGTARILPAFAQVKLSHEASEALGFDGSQRRAPVPVVIDKERYQLASGFSPCPTQPRKFFLLKRSDRLHVEPLEPRLRFKALLRFSYVSRFGPQAMLRQAAARHVSHCAAIANTCEIAILEVPNDLSALDRLVATIENEAEALANAG
ncbi:MAG TPA: serine kinase [Novosphingobium sp.]|nr:serine kinase [Novosphingobium sp.]